MPQFVKSLPAGSAGDSARISTHTSAVLSTNASMNRRCAVDSSQPRGKDRNTYPVNTM